MSGIPPHGCGVPWPGTEGGVAEWRWGCRGGSLAGQGLERTVLPVRGGGQSPVGGRDLAVGMSRRDRSPVGNGCGEGFPEPLQGRDMAPRIARIARVSAERVCGERRAVFSVAVHVFGSGLLVDIITGRKYKILGLNPKMLQRSVTDRLWKVLLSIQEQSLLCYFLIQ